MSVRRYQSCETCRFFVTEYERGECRADAPSAQPAEPIGRHGDGSFIWAPDEIGWPPVPPTGWCGRWQMTIEAAGVRVPERPEDMGELVMSLRTEADDKSSDIVRRALLLIAADSIQKLSTRIAEGEN